MKVVVAGSRSLPAGASSFAFPLLDALGEDDVVLLRKPKHAEANHFESIIAAYCRYRNVGYKFYEPQPTEDAPGRASVYVRDNDMLDAADRVVLFISRDAVTEGNSGTFHLLERSINSDIAVDAFSVGYDGMRLQAERIGSL